MLVLAQVARKERQWARGGRRQRAGFKAIREKRQSPTRA
jgi:hypothetical protein